MIAKIIIAEIKAGSFTYSGFYERRVRRIMPTLLLVVLVSILASLILSLPNQVEEAAWSGIFAIFGVSNVYFWTQSWCFAPASDFQMLLHTWSLGVEEQFYLLLPPLLFFIFRFKINLRFVMLAALPLLFVAGLWLSFNKPSVAFFLLPARAWELALGVALAAGVLPRWSSASGNSIIALLGLGAIIASIFVIDKQMAFPGWAALMPCFGAATVIYAASDDNLVGRFLAITPLRFIGLIS